MYKLVSVLKTRHVEPWEKDMSIVKSTSDISTLNLYATAVRKAVEYGWFEGDQPDVDELIPKETMELGEKILAAYNKCMGIDLKN